MTGLTPEEFSVGASYDGEQSLDCPVCGWGADLTDRPIGDRPHVPANADLGTLLEAARAHIADKHVGGSYRRMDTPHGERVAWVQPDGELPKGWRDLGAYAKS